MAESHRTDVATALRILTDEIRLEREHRATQPQLMRLARPVANDVIEELDDCPPSVLDTISHAFTDEVVSDRRPYADMDDFDDKLLPNKYACPNRTTSAPRLQSQTTEVEAPQSFGETMLVAATAATGLAVLGAKTILRVWSRSKS